MPELDILFLNLHRRYLNFEADFGGFLGIYYLSAYLRKNLYAAKGFSGTLNQGKKILDNFLISAPKIKFLQSDFIATMIMSRKIFLSVAMLKKILICL